MRFLIDANMPRRTTDVIVASGHDAVDVRAIGLASATDAVIALRSNQRAGNRDSRHGFWRHSELSTRQLQRHRRIIAS